MAHSPELQRFYGSKAWRDLRNMLVISRNGHCDRCGKDFSTEKYQLIAHHKEHLTDENLKDPQIALNPDNIEILCAQCHAFYHDDRGYIRPPRQVFLVYGSPCAGKSTYVRENANIGDLIVDLDLIYKAISPAPLYQHTEQIKRVAFGVRDYLYDQIRIRNGSWNTAWIIAGMPRKDERERLAARLGASLILVESTKEECYKKLLSANDGRDLDAWRDYIDKWFLDYQA